MGRALVENTNRSSQVSVQLSDMVSLRAIIGLLLDFLLAYITLVGWCITYFTECHVNLFCAWLVSLSDIMFLANSLGKWSKAFYQTLQRVLPFSPVKSTSPLAETQPGTHVGRLLSLAIPLAFVPYHFLVILEVDGPGAYAVVCALRLVWIVRTQWVSVSIFSDNTQDRRTSIQPTEINTRNPTGSERNADWLLFRWIEEALLNAKPDILFVVHFHPCNRQSKTTTLQ